MLEFRLSHHCTTGLDRAPCSLPHCLAPCPRLESHHPAGRAMADPAQHKRETAPGLADQWCHGDVICFCVSASCATAGACTLLGPYPQAHRASQLRSLRRAPADLITGRITSFVSPHHTMARSDVGDSYGRRKLARSCRVVGSREGGSSFNSAGLVAVASANLRMAKRVSGRARRGGERRNTAVSGHRIREVRLERSLASAWTKWARFSGARALGGSSAR